MDCWENMFRKRSDFVKQMISKSRWIYFIALGCIILGIPLLVKSEYWLHLFIVSGIYLFVCLGCNLLMGYTGQVSLAPQSFYAIGAYTAALLTIHMNLPFVISFIAAGMMAGIVGIILGLPAIRLSGHYLAIATLGFAVIVEIIIQNWDSVTMGYAGLTGINSPTIPILNYKFYSKASYYFLILFLLILTLYFFYRLISSKTGRAFRAIKEDEIAAEVCAIHRSYYKLLAFAISSMLAGFGGAFYSQYILFVSPEVASFNELVNVFAMTIVGGVGNIAGSIVGAILLTFLPEMMRDLKDYRLILYGGMLIVIILFMPKGIWSLFVRLGSLLAAFSIRGKKDDEKQKPVLFEATGSQDDRDVFSFVGRRNHIFEVNRINKSFSGLQANQEISFEIEEGKILSIIGPNGSGKTTLLNVISGYYPQDSGTIRFYGKTIDGLRPDQIAALGLARTFQISRLFRDMTVVENLLVGMHLDSDFSLFDELLNTHRKRSEEDKLFQKANRLLGEFDLSSWGNETAGSLPYGMQRIIEIMRAVSSNPKLILLDEPAAGMNLQEIKNLKRLLRLLQRRGITIILVEHVMDVVMDISDFIIVLDYGRKIAEGRPEEIQNNPEVKRAYLGGI